MSKFIIKIVIFLAIGLFLLFPALASPQHYVLYSDQVAVLAYHHIDNAAKSNVTITSDLFEAQLKDLLSRGYHFITLTQFKKFLAGGPVPDNAVLVTFDDGYESFYTYAFPVLEKLHIPAVNFVITRGLDDPRYSKLPSLTRDEVAQMAKSPVEFDFECHTDSLHEQTADGKPLFTSLLMKDGRQETQAEYEHRIIDDTMACRRKLESLQQGEVDAFAYPFGIYDGPSSQLIAQAGIRYAFTTVSEMATRDVDPMQIPRINAGSPFIRPNSINNLIVRKVQAPLSAQDNLPLRKAISDIGGSITVDSSGKLTVHYQQNNYSLDSIKTKPAPDEIYANLGAVEKLLNVNFAYNPITGTYFVRHTQRRAG